MIWLLKTPFFATRLASYRWYSLAATLEFVDAWRELIASFRNASVMYNFDIKIVGPLIKICEVFLRACTVNRCCERRAQLWRPENTTYFSNSMLLQLHRRIRNTEIIGVDYALTFLYFLWPYDGLQLRLRAASSNHKPVGNRTIYVCQLVGQDEGTDTHTRAIYHAVFNWLVIGPISTYFWL